MSGNQLMTTNPSLLDEINMLVKGNEDLTSLISDVLKKRRTFPNTSGPAGTGSSTERPRQILVASSTESCDDVPPDELSLCPTIENVAAKLSKIVLSDVEGSPLSNSYTVLRAYEDFADDEASSDDSCDSLSSWLTIESDDSKYPSTLDDYYDDSSFDESSESGSVYGESMKSNSGTSPACNKDLNGNYQPADECDEKSKHYSSTTESSSEIEALKDEDKSASAGDSSESNDKLSVSSKTVDSCDAKSKHYSSSTESNSDVEVLENEDKSASSDDSSDSNDKLSDSSKTVDSCDEKLKHCDSTESDSDIEATDSEKKSDSSDGSSESDEKSSDSSKTVDLCDEESKHYSSSTESNSEIEELDGENKSGSAEISSDDSSESDGKSSDDSTGGKGSMEEVDGERIAEEKDSSEESRDYESSESCTSESEAPSNDIESSSRDSSIVKSDGDSTDSLTNVSSDSSEVHKSDENQSRKSPSERSSASGSGDEMWIEPRRRLSDWGDSSLIQSDDSMVCMKAGKDKIIISKRNRIGEIQAIYFFPDFVKWRGSSSTSKNESPDESDSKASSSSNESEPPEAAEKCKINRQHKRYNHLDPFKKETSSSDVDLLKSVLTGARSNSTSISSSEESEHCTEISPSYKKYPSISEDLSPRNELDNGQRGPQSHKSNTYRKFSDVDGRM